jgi:hypothetical protein
MQFLFKEKIDFVLKAADQRPWTRSYSIPFKEEIYIFSKAADQRPRTRIYSVPFQGRN